MTTLQFVQSVLDWLLADPAHVIAAASTLAAMTPTPDPGTVRGKLYRVLEIFALNFLHAKDTGTPAKPAAAAPPSPAPAAATTALALLVLIGCAFGLAACAAPQDSAQTVYALEASYNALAQVETAYEQSAQADPAVSAHIKALDQVAYDALVAARNAAESGQSSAVTTSLAAGQSALADLANYLAQEGVAR